MAQFIESFILGIGGLGLGSAGTRTAVEEEDLERPGDHEVACEFAKRNSIREQVSDRCCCRVSSKEGMESHSVGLELYFVFLKQMIFVFFIISMISF